EAGKLQLNASKNDIIPFIEDIKLSFEELARVRQIIYTFNAPNDPIPVWFDKINLKKIVFNLLSNAFKFTPDAGEISVNITTTTKKIKKGKPIDYLKLVVKDSGRGIPEKSLKAV